MKHVRADFPYLAAVLATEAGPDEFRTICDWSNWVGPWQESPINLQTNGRRRFLILTTVSRPTYTLHSTPDFALMLCSSIRRRRI